jgi:hypothetical protein
MNLPEASSHPISSSLGDARPRDIGFRSVAVVQVDNSGQFGPD